MTPVWRAIRAEITPFHVLEEVRGQKRRCEVTGLEKKVRIFLGQIECEATLAVFELSFAQCVQTMSKVYCGKGGCDNTVDGRIVSIMTNGRSLLR